MRENRKITDKKPGSAVKPRRWKWLTAVLSAFVAVGTTVALTHPAITLGRNSCDFTEHSHEDSCYELTGNQIVSCTAEYHFHSAECKDAEGNVICGLEEIVHTHGPECYVPETKLICQLEEHDHGVDCVWLEDREYDEKWAGYLPEELSGNWNADLLATAQSQLGYAESDSDQSTAEDGTLRGATMYGLKYNRPYAPWQTAFVGFCLEHVGVTGELPFELDLDTWQERLAEKEYLSADDTPVLGDIVFLDTDADGAADAVGVFGVDETEEIGSSKPWWWWWPWGGGSGEVDPDQPQPEEPEFLVIRGDVDNAVSYVPYDPEELTSYVSLVKARERYDALLADMAAADAVNKLIAALPEAEEFRKEYDALSASQKDARVAELTAAIAEAETAYAGLTETQLSLVLNYEKLTLLKAHIEALGEGEDNLKFSGDGYQTTLTAMADAALPAGAVISARPVSGDLATSGNSAETYEDSISGAISWGEVRETRLYNINIIQGDSAIQPSAPVEVKTEFTAPITLGPGEVLYAVHMGEEGAEILPAITERDENGNIISATHVQSSFSVSGYVLVHISNPKDIGPDILPVHYCIWVNDQWIIAGSTRTGWYGNYIDSKDWTTETRDYITLEQMGSVLGEYGLDVTDHDEVWRTTWYQRAEDSGKTIRHDTRPESRTVVVADGTSRQMDVFLLSGNMVKDDGYHIYYVPEGTVGDTQNSESSTYARNRELGAALKTESKFYTMTVRDMNRIVYKEGEEVPPVKIIRYGEFVEVKVKANESLGWQWVNDSGKVVHGINRIYDTNGDGVFDEPVDERFGYTPNGDGTETYTFTGILGRTTLIPYSVAVDGAEQTTEKQVDIVVYLDDEWQKVGQLNLMYRHEGVCVRTHEDGTAEPLWFVTAGQVYTILKDFGFDPGSYSPDDITNSGHAFTHAIGAFTEGAAETLEMHADGVNDVLNTAVAIGFGEATAGNNFTLFYLPGSSNEAYTDVHRVTPANYAETEKIKGDGFYSIRVVDDYQLVYYGYETDNFKVYVPEGGSATVKVQNALSVLWSVRDHEEFTAVQDGNFNVYNFTNVTFPIEIEASSLNPSYIVQYWSTIVRYQLGKETKDAELVSPTVSTVGGIRTTNLALIDTRDGMPKNTARQDTVDITLTQVTESNSIIESIAQQNNGQDSKVFEVGTYDDFTEIYREEDFIFEKANLWKNIDKLWQNDNYAITEIWILKDGMDPESENRADWWIYRSETNGRNITFTNLASEETIERDPTAEVQPDGEHTILLTQGMIIRLCYEYVEATDFTVNDVTFYDYDITNGESGGYWDARQKGINSAYPGADTTNVYGFGNINCQTGQGAAQWNENFLNAFNTGKYGGCTFGLVDGLDADKLPTWSDQVKGLNIFGKTNATGKTVYEGGSLTFNRRGDVYTLSASNSTVGTRTGLEYFFNPSDHSGRIYDGVSGNKAIFTNNFWAVENADHANRKDANWGKYNDKVYINGYNDDTSSPNKCGSETKNTCFPVADDGNNHNYFFGMEYSVSFNISEDYTGPLEYIFFGDDDMWVFLDKADGTTELICDIGGVHSAVGQYVDLRDYLPVGAAGTAGTHTLRFYYTERGASGSTCWMSFTLPSVTSTIEEKGTAQISIAKTVVNSENQPITPDETYDFIVKLYTDEHKQVIVNTPFSVEIKRADGHSDYFATKSGNELSIGAGDKAMILGVPIGTYYVIEEKQDDRFWVEANGKEAYVVEGTAEEDVNEATFINHQHGYALPDTGGNGKLPFILAGSILTTAATALICAKAIKRRKEEK